MLILHFIPIFEDKDFADKMVEIEKDRAAHYKNAWNEALSLTKEQRLEKFLRYF